MNKEERFIVYDTESEQEVHRMSESEFRIYLAKNGREDLLKKLFDYKPLNME